MNRESQDPFTPAEAAFSEALHRSLPTTPASEELHARVRQLALAHAQRSVAGPASDEPATETALLAAIEIAFLRVLREVRSDDSLAISAIVDRVARLLWEDRLVDRAVRLLYHRLAADVMRRTLYRLARRKTSSVIPEVSEPVFHGQSLVRFDAAEAIDLHEWWDAFAEPYSEKALLYSLHRFAGRSFAEVGELVSMPEPDVRRHCDTMGGSVGEFRAAKRTKTEVVAAPRAVAGGIR